MGLGSSYGEVQKFQKNAAITPGKEINPERR
jgi:hypothetical protein